MITTVKWIATLLQKDPLKALIVSLLIATAVTFSAARVFYKDNKEGCVRCEIEKKGLNERILHLEKENDALHQSAIQYYNQKKIDDSVTISELRRINKTIDEKSKTQEQVNKIQKTNIVKREKALQAGEKVKQKNEQKINALKNELKK